ncbi:hypothetical protein A3A68_00840 [Candidatus Saccharibacteria bacterium RIFCSPLOWO2_01_FULL_48_13]|nr:MAG: hypothetical protein A2884_01290 [Candidatus Saccharibacteria bacterium RIFCSPHIGHO2_01_FULL_48_12]OGL36319.1 MAG: hypothetical protein A3F38_00730 [Candidatus Saccharibacteria bacterium RIFCSPHIGHO2_12_FULL_48_21]OGL36970.1 MAG: hypothetical protein A3A68_00840 [Candidatus Saccharibacteria bacterium RIFCSPLOWO2_01_FULL_48_13]
MKNSHNNSGFTITELMIATLAFSIILLAAVAGFLQIGRMFYRGINANQTQVNTKQLVDQLSADIQNSAAITPITNPDEDPNTYTYFCVGNVRYTVNFNRRLNVFDTDNVRKYGVLRDQLPGATACAEPCVQSCTPTQVAFANPTEMLGNGMRLDELSYNTTSDLQMRNIKIRIVYGDDLALTTFPEPPAPPNLPQAQNYACNAQSSVSNFCADSYMSNAVFAGGF